MWTLQLWKQVPNSWWMLVQLYLPSGLPKRPNGINNLVICIKFSGTVSVIGVSMKPGNTALTLMLNLSTDKKKN